MGKIHQCGISGIVRNALVVNTIGSNTADIDGTAVGKVDGAVQPIQIDAVDAAIGDVQGCLIVKCGTAAGGGTDINTLTVDIGNVDIAVVGKRNLSIVFGRTAQAIALIDMVDEQCVKIITLHIMPARVIVKALLLGIVNVYRSEITELKSTGKVAHAFALSVIHPPVSGALDNKTTIIYKRELAIVGVVVIGIRSGAVNANQPLVKKVEDSGSITGLVEGYCIVKAIHRNGINVNTANVGKIDFRKGVVAIIGYRTIGCVRGADDMVVGKIEFVLHTFVAKPLRVGLPDVDSSPIVRFKIGVKTQVVLTVMVIDSALIEVGIVPYFSHGDSGSTTIVEVKSAFVIVVVNAVLCGAVNGDIAVIVKNKVGRDAIHIGTTFVNNAPVGA